MQDSWPGACPHKSPRTYFTYIAGLVQGDSLETRTLLVSCAVFLHTKASSSTGSAEFSGLAGDMIGCSSYNRLKFGCAGFPETWTPTQESIQSFNFMPRTDSETCTNSYSAQFLSVLLNWCVNSFVCLWHENLPADNWKSCSDPFKLHNFAISNWKPEDAEHIVKYSDDLAFCTHSQFVQWNCEPQHPHSSIWIPAYMFYLMLACFYLYL